jgi:hypothetical protein
MVMDRLLPGLFSEGIMLEGRGHTVKDGMSDSGHGEGDAGAMKRAKRSCKG